MGRPKALLPIAGTHETFLQRVTRTLIDAGIDEVIVVVGADGPAIRRDANPLPRGVRIIDNPRWAEGQLTSLLAGLNAIDITGARGILMTLVDVPLVSVATVRRLLAVQKECDAPIVRPVSNGRHGHPVIFGRVLFEELRAADPASGAKPVVRAHEADIVEVPVDDEGAFADIDTRDDYQRLIGELNE